MGKVREFWCWLANWTLWPTVRGFGMATAIFILLIIIAVIVHLIRRLF